MGKRAVPLILLIAALAGIAVFSRGLRIVDTVGMLTCGLVAGASLAAIAAGRHRLRQGYGGPPKQNAKAEGPRRTS